LVRTSLSGEFIDVCTSTGKCQPLKPISTAQLFLVWTTEQVE
jgi:hypothetical protein